MMQKTLKNDWNPDIWVLIWEYSGRAIQWIPTWQGLDLFQIFLHTCAWDKSSFSIGRVKSHLLMFKRLYMKGLPSVPWWTSGRRHCHWLLAVFQHCQGLNTVDMWKSCQWLDLFHVNIRDKIFKCVIHSQNSIEKKVVELVNRRLRTKVNNANNKKNSESTWIEGIQPNEESYWEKKNWGTFYTVPLASLPKSTSGQMKVRINLICICECE